MYELIILSLLVRAPFNGYLIVKIANDQIGPWAKISSGSLYPLLSRMEREGLIAVQPQPGELAGNGRTSRVFTITDEGRRRFHQLILDMSSAPGDYQRIFRFKMISLDLIQPEERLLLFNHYLNYCQMTILHIQNEMADLGHEITEHDTFRTNVLNVMRHVEQQWQAEVVWVRGLREQEEVRQADSPAASEKEGD
jgi:DNA-binding PadR family transcriptional regulator